MSFGIFRRLSLVVFALALLALPLAHVQPAGAQTSTISLEQELVERYAPIVEIKQQTVECSADGEQFRPVSVDIIFDTDDVRLMHYENGKDVEVKRNINASDLYGLDDSYYIDLPFDPRNPGCDYEKWGKQRMAELGIEPSLYAKISTEEGQHGIVIQYWYYWIYNLFNDVHESDWEGIELYFDADSVGEILENNLLPTQVAFAQHAGGELGTWGAEKVETQGTHVVSHPSSGSHADYYEPAIWLGWGENGSGFGCDHSDDPEEELPVKIILLPDDVTGPGDPFAWLTYDGYWGEREVPGLFTGPKGPNGHWRYSHPITWLQDIRKNSLPVPEHPTIGPAISEVFCGAAEFGSKLVILFGVNSRDISLLIIGFGVALLAFSLLVWRFTVQAVWLYFRHGYYFITIGAAAVPIALLTRPIEARLQDLLVTHATSRLPDSLFWRTTYEFVLRSMVAGVQALLMAAIIGPFAIYGTYHITRLERHDTLEMWTQSFAFLPRVFGSRLVVGLLVRILMLTIVLAPLAIYKWVQWFFAPQAVVVDQTSIVDSVHVSKGRISRGHWARAAAMVVAFHALVGLPAPLIGAAALILGGVKLEHAQLISGLLYCVLFPIAMIAATLFYLNRTLAPGTFAPYVPPAGEH
jgi:hypothetical protein